ncbi:MAG: isochorismate synthase [Chloroflexi bacterium]|nr:isochorismate synthase [Chloroflexota bacterium]MYD65169.1 isochorismate synthase [Chloroflexota bacterium]
MPPRAALTPPPRGTGSLARTYTGAVTEAGFDDASQRASTPRATDSPGLPDRAEDAPTRPADAAEGRFHVVELPERFDPRVLLNGATASTVSAYYERPDQDLVLAGIGVAARVVAPPGRGATALREPARKLLDAWDGSAKQVLRPRLLGGFAFDDAATGSAHWAGFDAGWLLLPRMLFIRERGVSGVVLAPDTDREDLYTLLADLAARDPAEREAPVADATQLRVLWDVNRPALLMAVASVAADIRSGAYEKAVLAATREMEAERPIEPGVALARLREGYPMCHLFSYRAGDGIFLGASPEQLAGLRDGRITTLGLAGSIRRGQTPEEDEELGDALLNSVKDRIEHTIVVRALREGLDELGTGLHAPNQPELLRLFNIQHLATQVTAEARSGVDVLDVVERLHPTPAVGGWPTPMARAVIGHYERFDRGWYAGPVGWIDAAGEGEFAVGLRSALVRGARAWLFAGAGIMGDSDPEAELAEIELKFRPLTTALGGGQL